jgi:hypothetical protein
MQKRSDMATSEDLGARLLQQPCAINVQLGAWDSRAVPPTYCDLLADGVALEALVARLDAPSTLNV